VHRSLLVTDLVPPVISLTGTDDSPRRNAAPRIKARLLVRDRSGAAAEPPPNAATRPDCARWLSIPDIAPFSMSTDPKNPAAQTPWRY
jgi:hypothetical protein